MPKSSANTILVELDDVVETKVIKELDADEIFDMYEGIQSEAIKSDECDCGGTFSMMGNVFTCMGCGITNADIMDFVPDWQNLEGKTSSAAAYGKSQVIINKMSRCGGKIIASGSNYTERTMKKIFDTVTKICNEHHIKQNVIDTTKILIRKITECTHHVNKKGNKSNYGKKIIIRGDNRRSIMACCTYAASKIEKMPIGFKMIARMYSLDDRRVTRGYNQFNNILIQNRYMELAYISRPCEPKYYIESYCKGQNSRSDGKIYKNLFTEEQIQLAAKISNNITRLKIASGHNPKTIAACSLVCMASIMDFELDRDFLAELFETSKVTINKIYKEIAEYEEYGALQDDKLADYLIEVNEIVNIDNEC